MALAKKLPPQNVVYLVEKGCKLPAVDQKTYIPFDRTNMRSIVEALALLFRGLKEAGVFRSNQLPEAMPAVKEFDFEAFFSSLPANIRQIVHDLSNSPSGVMSDVDFRKHLKEKRSLTDQDANFAMRAVESFGVAVHRVQQQNNLSWNLW